MAHRSTLSRFALVLPLLVAATVLPVVSMPRRAHVVYRTMALRSRGVLKAAGSFGLVGVSWPAGDVRPRAVRLRTSEDGRHWTGWTDVEIGSDEGPDPGTGEAQNVSTSPLWVGHARFVDVGWDGAMPQNAKVAVVDPGPDPAPQPASAAEASPSMPRIITRAQWGADESMRKGTPEYAEPVQMAFVHHTASGNDYSASQSAGIVRSIYAYHVQTNGWNDIGYNFLVDKYGQIFEGRYGGMTRALVGAHTLGFNAHSTGVAVIGSFGSSAPPSAAISALKSLLAWRLDVAYVDPNGSTTMTSGGNPRYVEGTRVNLRTISGHRDVYDTDCPGSAFYAQLPSIRSAVEEIGDPKMFAPSLSPGALTPNGDGVADTITFTARFAHTVDWTAAVQNPGGTTLASTSGTGNTMAMSWNGKSGSTVLPQDTYQFVINAHNGHGTMRTTVAHFNLWRFPDGTLLRSTSSGWAGILQNGHLGHLVSLAGLQSRYVDAETVWVSEAIRSAYPAGGDLGFRDGSVVRVGSDTWVISDGQRRRISDAVFSALGYNTGSIVNTTSPGLAPTPQGSDVTVAGGYPDGAALHSTDGREALRLSGLVRPFITTNVRRSYVIRDVDLVGPADTQVSQGQTNPPVGFRDGTLVEATGTSTVYIVSDGVRRRFPSMHEFGVMGYKTANIRQVTPAELALNTEGAPL